MTAFSFSNLPAHWADAASLPDNTNRLVSPARMRAALTDLLDSIDAHYNFDVATTRKLSFIAVNLSKDSGSWMTTNTNNVENLVVGNEWTLDFKSGILGANPKIIASTVSPSGNGLLNGLSFGAEVVYGTPDKLKIYARDNIISDRVYYSSGWYSLRHNRLGGSSDVSFLWTGAALQLTYSNVVKPSASNREFQAMVSARNNLAVPYVTSQSYAGYNAVVNVAFYAASSGSVLNAQSLSMDFNLLLPQCWDYVTPAQLPDMLSQLFAFVIIESDA